MTSLLVRIITAAMRWHLALTGSGPAAVVVATMDIELVLVAVGDALSPFTH